MRTLSRLLVVGLLATSASTFAVSPAAATDVTPMAPLCDNIGQKWYSVTNVVKPQTLTHGERHYNGTTGTVTASYSTEHQTTLTAGITVTAGVQAEAGAIISKMSVSASVSLAASGSSTETWSVGVTATVPSFTYIVTYRGRVKVTANFKHYHCNSNGYLITLSEGTGRSFSVAESGAQQCNLGAPGGSLAALAKSQWC